MVEYLWSWLVSKWPRAAVPKPTVHGIRMHASSEYPGKYFIEFTEDGRYAGTIVNKKTGFAMNYSRISSAYRAAYRVLKAKGVYVYD